MMTIWVLMDGLTQKIELKTDHDAGADAIRVNRFRREHQEATVLEMCIYVAWRKSA